MARNIRWFANFKSLNGTSCTINIYDNDWPAGVTKGVTAAADPFFFEEDDSDDLLNDVVRYRTGYIRLVEQISFGDLADIYPTGIFDRYVEVLYGGTVVFNGYIQVQDFDSEQVPAPRVLEFPVISPLGLMNQKTFIGIIPPTSKTLGELLDTAIIQIGSYDYVFLPKNYGYPNPVSLSMKVFSTAVTPLNKNFHHSRNIGTQNMVMKGETYSYLIEAICKAFGWICHDMPGALIFTAFDYEGDYCYYPVGHIGEVGYSTDANIQSSASELTFNFTPADDAANMTTLQPDTGIEIEYDGDSTLSQEFNFDNTYVSETSTVITMPSYINDPDEINSICNLERIPLLNNISVYTILAFDNQDLLTIGKGICAWNGKEGVMISMSGTESSYNEIFWVRFYMKRRGRQIYRVKYNMIGRKNGYLLQLANSGSDIDEYYIYAIITPYDDDYVKVTFYYRFDGDQHPRLQSQAVIFISDIELEVEEDGEPYTKYRYIPTDDKDIIPEQYNPQPAISSTVTMPISLYRLNDRLIGTTVRQTKVATYPYLFTPRKELVSKFRISSILSFPHIRLFTYMDKRWRIIAQAFRPWDDEYTLTMQNSNIL